MKPSDKELKQWVNGSLEGDELEQVEAWVNENQEEACNYVSQFEAEEQAADELGASNLMKVIGDMPQSIEPPYPDFFNSKLAQRIAEIDKPDSVKLQPKEDTTIGIAKFWRWFTAPAVVALMALCFLLGVNSKQDNVAQSIVYVPSDQVHVIEVETDEATMIVLEGLKPLDDDLFEETVESKKTDTDYQMISTRGTNMNLF